MPGRVPSDCVSYLTTLTWIMMTSIHTPANQSVILTNWSAAREPHGLDPPTPPNAPASPPPLPRWISTISMSNRPRPRTTRFRTCEYHATAISDTGGLLRGPTGEPLLAGHRGGPGRGPQAAAAACTIFRKSAGLRLAPPISPPSMSGCAIRPAALSPVTDPPYRIGSATAILSPYNAAIRCRML